MNRLEKSEKITQNTGKVGEFLTNVIYVYIEVILNCVLFAQMDQVFSLEKNVKKYTGKMEKKY